MVFQKERKVCDNVKLSSMFTGRTHDNGIQSVARHAVDENENNGL